MYNPAILLLVVAALAQAHQQEDSIRPHHSLIRQHGQRTFGVMDHFFAPSSANTNHYGNPGTGCLEDELPISVQGISGGMCSASCKTQACPQDKPEGCEAVPRCALENRATGDKFCALMCDKNTNCGEGATCKVVQAGVGICTYDLDKPALRRESKHKFHHRKQEVDSDSDDSDDED